MKRWCIALVALLGLQAHGFAQATDEPAQKAAPTLYLAPSEERSGSTVKASGKGYCGSVILRWDDEVQLNSGESDERGNISITFTVPSGAALGRHTVTSTSECGGTRASFSVVPGVVSTSTPAPPPATTTPPPATTEPLPGTTEPPPGTTEPPPGTTEPPPSTTTAPPATPDGALDSYKDSTLAQLEDIAKRELESGVILYNPPEQMRVGDVNRVEVRIAREESDGLAEGLQGKGNPRVEELRVGTTMRAKLEGGAFDIMPIGSDVQQLASKGFLEWRWDVIPTVSGSHSLFLIVSVLHEKYPGVLAEEPPFERQIDVAVNPGYSLSKWLSNNWEKLVAALVGIIGIIEGYRRLRLRRADDGSGGMAPDRGSGLKHILGRRRARNRR